MAYQPSEMSPAEIDQFLQVPRFAIVGTNRKNGPPQLTPVWYLYENEKVYLVMFVKSVKYQNLSRDARIGVCIAGDNPDCRAVMIYGTAELFPEGNEWVNEVRWRLVRRYYDSDQEARAFMDTAAGGGDWALVVVTPEKFLAQDCN